MSFSPRLALGCALAFLGLALILRAALRYSKAKSVKTRETNPSAKQMEFFETADDVDEIGG